MVSFLSTPSARRATDAGIDYNALDLSFYPRPPRGGRRWAFTFASTASVFLSTPSARRATVYRWIRWPHTSFLSTPSARRATTVFPAATAPFPFLSTPSARRATSSFTLLPPAGTSFYPRPPRGGRPTAGGLDLLGQGFLSTPSARRATHGCQHFGGTGRLSIHALREEGDGSRLDAVPPAGIFLSTPSARRATVWHCPDCNHRVFLSTPSARRATPLDRLCNRHRKHFLSTPSARRATIRAQDFDSVRTAFYPRPPRGGRPALVRRRGRSVVLSIHALREEGDKCPMYSRH